MSHGSALRYPITPAEKAAYTADGVVCLRQQFDAGWVARLREATDEVLSSSAWVLEYTPAGKPGRFASGLFMWRQHPVFREFVEASPAAAIAGELMGSTRIHLLADNLLVKEPGTLDATRWHHDLPFWPVDGEQVCSVWVALDRVTRETGGVEYVAGSHRWPCRFRPIEPYTEELKRRLNMDLPPCPTFHDRRDQYRVLSWDLAPGDCVVFTALTVHGAEGNSSSDTRRRALSTRWCGDGVTFIDGPFVLDLPGPSGLRTGDPLGGDLFPLLWEKESATERGRP